MTRDQEEFVERNSKIPYFVYYKLLYKTDLIKSNKEDLIQEGFVALCLASKLYNKEKDTSETNYCIQACKNKMLRYIKHYIYHNENIESVDYINIETLEGDFGEILDKHAGKDLQRYYIYIKENNSIEETDKKVLCECLHSDILKYAEIYVNKNNAFNRTNLIQPYNLKDILNMIESGFTNEQIGKRFGVSKQRINQIIKKIKMILPKDYEKYLT